MSQEISKYYEKGVDFDFGIGGDNTVTLLDAGGDVLSEVSLLGTGTDDQTFALVDGKYKYTDTPTPGMENVYTEPMPLEEKLHAQNLVGADFFS